MIEKVKTAFGVINWLKYLHKILLSTFAFYISLTIDGYSILAENNLLNSYSVIKHFFIISGILSIIGFSTYLIIDLNYKTFFNLFFGFIAYLIVSYFLLITRNINNSDFNVWKLTDNHFFEYRGLIVVVLIIILSFIIKSILDKFSLKDLYSSFFQEYYKSDSTIYFLIVFIILSDSKLIPIISKTVSDGKIADFIPKLTLNIFLLFITFYCIVRIVYKAIEAIRNNNPNFYLSAATSLLFGVIFNYTLQYGVKTEGSLMDMFVFPGATAYQITFIFVFCIIGYLIINRYVITTFLEIVFWGVISLVNYLKQKMRNEPLLVSDISWLKEAKLLTKYIDGTIIIYALIAIVFLIAIAVFLRKRFLSGKIISKKRYRGIGIGIDIVVITFFSMIMVNESDGNINNNIPILSQLNNNYNVFWLGNSVHATYRSLAYVWTKELTFPVMETPDGYSKEKIQKIAKRYQSEAEKINATRTEKISDQTVIYILSESLANPNRIPGITTSENVLPYIDEIISNTTSGLMKSDGYGGGTANMEYQTLTGLPMYNLSSSMTSLTTEIVPEMTYIPSISDSFKKKNRIAIHLGDAQTYSRINMYDKMNFDQFIAGQNGTMKAKNMVALGHFPSDNSTYSTLLENINFSENQFFSVITYQNHVPWSYDYDKLITVAADQLSNEEIEQLTNYANLLHQTDIDTKDLLDQLSNIDKKIVVVFYGDHLPGLYPQSLFDTNSQLQYKTDYFIWSNYQTKKMDYPYVNSSDFPAELLEYTNSKVSPYYALLTDVLKYSSVDKKILDEKGKEVADDLKLIEYDLSQGKGYITNYNGFFEMN